MAVHGFCERLQLQAVLRVLTVVFNNAYALDQRKARGPIIPVDHAPILAPAALPVLLLCANCLLDHAAYLSPGFNITVFPQSEIICYPSVTLGLL